MASGEKLPKGSVGVGWLVKLVIIEKMRAPKMDDLLGSCHCEGVIVKYGYKMLTIERCRGAVSGENMR